MGSQQFKTYSKGMSVNEAYNRAVEDASDTYGHQEGYSGEINSTAGFRDITEEYKRSKKDLHEFVDAQLDKLTKFDGARAICLVAPIENTNKTKSQVQHIVTPGTKKWVLKYVVYNHHDNPLGSFDTKGDAVEHARKRTEKTQQPTFVHMEKVLENGNPIVAKISYKKSTKEKEGRWVFFGWASC